MRALLLRQFAADLDVGSDFDFVKFGDGELLCMLGQSGATCDGQLFTRALALALLASFDFFARRPRSYVAEWVGTEAEAVRYTEIKRLLAERAGARPSYVPFNLLLPQAGDSSPELLDFYMAVKRTPRRKVFVGPGRLAGASKMLDAEHLITPLRGAFALRDQLRARLEALAPQVAIFSCGPCAKVLAHDVAARGGVTCLDVGSGFDAAFVGRTRADQPSQEEAREFFAPLYANGHLQLLV